MRSLKCAGCLNIVSPSDILLTIGASAGPRAARDGTDVRWSWSPFPTISRNIPVCRTCLEQPEMAAILEMISAPWSQPEGHGGERCVILCRGRRPLFWLAAVRRRLQLWPDVSLHRCPGCSRPALLWPAPIAPEIHRRELAEVTGAGQRSRPQYVPSERIDQPRPALPGAQSEGITDE